MTHVIADHTGPAPTEAPRFDGFDLAYATTPGHFADFVDLVVPELGSRGRIAAPSGGATLRERLHGAPPHSHAASPGLACRAEVLLHLCTGTLRGGGGSGCSSVTDPPRR
ncbi:hypothetical protein ACWET9_28990 [Streptomyces sp. NPDC004059]